MLSYLPDVADASRSRSPGCGDSGRDGRVRSLACVRGGTVTAGGAVPLAGELAVFCRPVVTAPAVARRDGSVLAEGGCRTSCGWASWSVTSATG